MLKKIKIVLSVREGRWVFFTSVIKDTDLCVVTFSIHFPNTERETNMFTLTAAEQPIPIL